jgi:hypothetical protein
MVMNDQLVRIWKEAVMFNVKVLSQHLSGGTDENYKASMKVVSPVAPISSGDCKKMKAC